MKAENSAPSQTQAPLTPFLLSLACLTVSWMAWFSPLCATKPILNAFALHYIGVNTIVFYTNLSILAVFSLPVANLIKAPSKQILNDKVSKIRST
jgi:hypothetical protein